MKSGPIVAMVALVFIGMWLVLQPALARGNYDREVRIGAEVLLVNRSAGIEPGAAIYEFLSPHDLAARGPVSAEVYEQILQDRQDAWESRPAIERALLGFFNISNWMNFGWVAIGLLGQGAFFGRMFVQWIVSEKSGESQVPEIFWWFSFIGGVFLFTYFVWRVDVVGVLGQSTGVVIYARNLRLIHKQKRRKNRHLEPQGAEKASSTPEPGEAQPPHEPT